MSHFCRICIAAVLVGVLVAPGLARDSASPLHERKLAVVQTALAANSPGEAAAAILAAVDKAHALVDIVLGQSPDDPALMLRVTGARGGAPGTPEVKVFDLDGGQRLVIDLLNTVNLSPRHTIEARWLPPVRAIRSSLYAIEPEFVSRVVLDLDLPCAHRVARDSDGVGIWLSAKDRGLATIQAAGSGRNFAKPLAGDARWRAGDAPGRAGVGELRVEVRTQGDETEVLHGTRGGAPEGAVDARWRAGRANMFEAHLASLATQLLEIRRTQEGPSAQSPAAEAETIAWSPAARTIRAPIDKLAAELVAVAAAEFDAPPNFAALDAALEDEPAEEGEPDSGEAPAEPAEKPALEPPPKREEPKPDTDGANVSIVSKMQGLIKQLGSGMDPFAEQGITTPGGPKPSVAGTKGMTTQPPMIMPLAKPAADARWRAGLAPAPTPKKYHGDPLKQPVNISFVKMELSNVVALFAQKAGINVIASTDLTGTVTADFKNVPLLQALESVLRAKGLGILKEEGIYEIVPYDEAITAKRVTTVLELENANSSDVRAVLEDIIKGSRHEKLISISDNKAANVVVIAAPESELGELMSMARQLDIEKPSLPTVTEALKLNYAEPTDLVELVKEMLTPEVGNVAADSRARHLVVTDVPAVVEQVRELIAQLDIAVKQVLFDTMIVDISLTDDADTGIDWLLKSVHTQSRSEAVKPDGRTKGTLQDLTMATVAPAALANPAGALSFGLLTDSINWRGVIQAEVQNQNARLISNPILVTVENKEAKITIAQEVPYREVNETEAGGTQTSTQFKDIGTVVTVTPRVTHDNHIIVELDAKESTDEGKDPTTGVITEGKRSIQNTLRVKSGQTIFVGGLRKNRDKKGIRKLPILGDIPLLNFAFRSHHRDERANELMIFLTCSVLDEEHPPLTDYQQKKFEEAAGSETKVNAQRALFHEMVHPGEMRDPIWKWRRSD